MRLNEHCKALPLTKINMLRVATQPLKALLEIEKIMTHSKMNRRLRKKLYLGQFAIIGFEFSCSIDEMDETKVNNFFSELLSFLESNNMLFDGGGTKDNFGGYITSKLRYGSLTEADSETLKTWLSSNAGVKDIHLADLSDAIYGYNEA